MKKYIQPAIYVFEIKMESALLGGSEIPQTSTFNNKEASEEYTHHSIWNNNAWTDEE